MRWEVLQLACPAVASGGRRMAPVVEACASAQQSTADKLGWFACLTLDVCKPSVTLQAFNPNHGVLASAASLPQPGRAVQRRPSRQSRLQERPRNIAGRLSQHTVDEDS